MQRRAPQRYALRFILFIKLRHSRIQVPAQIIEFRARGERAHFRHLLSFHVLKADHHVSHLHARVVDVVLHLHAFTGVTQNSRNRVAQHRVPQVPDMCRFIWIYAGVLYDDFTARKKSSPRLDTFCVSVLSFFFVLCRCPKLLAIEKRIQISSPRHLDPRNAGHWRQTIRDLLRNLPRRSLQPFRHLKAHWRSCFAHFQFRRLVQRNGNLHAILFADVHRQSFAQLPNQFQVQVFKSSYGLTGSQQV